MGSYILTIPEALIFLWFFCIFCDFRVEAVLGAWQEYKSDKCLDSLRESSVPSAKVIRNGIKTEIPAGSIVPGDIITLEAGDLVPADARLVESHGLELIESSLTGETFSIYKKNVDIPFKNIPLGDRTNMVFRGTAVAKGNGKAIVVATGTNTEIGKIANRLGETKIEKTPLQKDLNNLSRFISWGCLGICAIITIGGFLGGRPFIEMFATGVSLAVGAIPEGLTTILAISLAFSAQRMAKKNAIIKSLPEMETLSCTKVICTDKTGTLTMNKMTVKELYTHKKFIKVTGEGYNSKGNFAEVLTIFAASILGMPTPLIPAQILMLNLVTEGIPALSLGLDPLEVDIMEEPPRNSNESILNSKIKNRIITRGIATGVSTLGIFGGMLFLTGNLIKARTMAFVNLVSCQMLHAFECSSMGIKRNKYLLPSVAISFGITLVSIYIPAFRGIFGMAPLNILDWAVIGLSTFVLSRIDDFFKDILYLAKMRCKSLFGI